MNHILGAKLPLREQFEVMYVRCVLKPIISRVKFLNSRNASLSGESWSLFSGSPGVPKTEGAEKEKTDVLSDQEDADEDD